MKRLSFIFFLVLSSNFIFAQNRVSKSFSIVACPGENVSHQINISWATDTTIKSARLEYTLKKDANWRRSVTKTIKGEICTVYDSIYSKTRKGADFYENAIINKYDAHLNNLKKSQDYKYRIITSDTSSVHYFKTSGNKEWSACIISDFHVYSPIYSRTKYAMEMIDTISKYSTPFEWVLHLGDITAWGASYSFWRDLYKEDNFHKYMWAGVNGNHDNMSRGYIKTSNEFFRYANSYPNNGYRGEEGVSYFFKYGNVLFIMLNNEAMKTEEGLKEAQDWVRDVVKRNPSQYKVVCEHYQWFYGADGKDSQYVRWNKLFDELGIDLALGANNHIYVSTEPIFNGTASKNGKGTIYIQAPSSDNERGVEFNSSEPLKFNSDKIKFRWSEGANTIGAMYLKVNKKFMEISLIDRYGNSLDKTIIYSKN